MRDKELRAEFDYLKKDVRNLEKAIHAVGSTSYKLEMLEKAIALLIEKNGTKRDCIPVSDQDTIRKFVGLK